jgi:methyltransferase
MNAPAGTAPPPVVALAGFVAVIVVERLLELFLSARHTRWIRARGGVEHGAAHFPWFVLFHVAYPVALAAEVLLGGARPGPEWPLWLVVFVAGQALRFAAIRALGPFWNVRIWVAPGMERVRRGPYRFMPHPNYVAVALELLAGALMFGAWRTALAATLVNLVLLRIRIHAEERALAGAARSG